MEKKKILYNRFFFIPNILIPPKQKNAPTPLKTPNRAYFTQRQTSITHGLMFHVKHLFSQAKHRNLCQYPAKNIPSKPERKEQKNKPTTSYCGMKNSIAKNATNKPNARNKHTLDRCQSSCNSIRKGRQSNHKHARNQLQSKLTKAVYNHSLSSFRLRTQEARD